MILLSDSRVQNIPVRESNQPLVRAPLAGPARGSARFVRSELADRLNIAAQRLPNGLNFSLYEGYRSPSDQRSIIASYSQHLRTAHPRLSDAEIEVLSSRFVSPLNVAPHVSGAAVDITLVDHRGDELWMGSRLDATPEESAGKCYTAATGLDSDARANRTVLCTALAAAGLVNYPSEWWHWSYGDRYWALTTGADHAIFGPVRAPELADHGGLRL